MECRLKLKNKQSFIEITGLKIYAEIIGSNSNITEWILNTLNKIIVHSLGEATIESLEIIIL